MLDMSDPSPPSAVPWPGIYNFTEQKPKAKAKRRKKNPHPTQDPQVQGLTCEPRGFPLPLRNIIIIITITGTLIDTVVKLLQIWVFSTKKFCAHLTPIGLYSSMLES